MMLTVEVVGRGVGASALVRPVGIHSTLSTLFLAHLLLFLPETLRPSPTLSLFCLFFFFFFNFEELLTSLSVSLQCCPRD